MTESDDTVPAETTNDDVGSPEGVATQRKRRKRADDRSKEFWRGVFADEVGRAEIWSLLSAAGAFQAPFAVGPNGFPQPDATWFKAGQQALALGLYHRWLALDFEGVRLMLTEHDQRFRDGK